MPKEKADNPNKAQGRETAPGQNKEFTNPTTGDVRIGTMGDFHKGNWADEGYVAPAGDSEAEADETPDTEPTA